MASGSVIKQILAKIGELLQANPHPAPWSGDGVNPLDELIARMTEQLVEAKNHIALCRAEESRLQQQVEIAANSAASWERRAMAAVRAGDDVVARDALTKKSAYDAEAEGLRDSVQKQKRDIEHLQQSLLDLNQRAQRTKNERNAILLEQQRAAPPELAEGAIESEAVVQDLAPHAQAGLTRLKQTLAKGKALRKKPLAKTLPGAPEKSAVQQGTGPETGIRRTKR